VKDSSVRIAARPQGGPSGATISAGEEIPLSAETSRLTVGSIQYSLAWVFLPFVQDVKF